MLCRIIENICIVFKERVVCMFIFRAPNWSNLVNGRLKTGAEILQWIKIKTLFCSDCTSLSSPTKGWEKWCFLICLSLLQTFSKLSVGGSQRSHGYDAAAEARVFFLLFLSCSGTTSVPASAPWRSPSCTCRCLCWTGVSQLRSSCLILEWVREGWGGGAGRWGRGVEGDI